MSLNAPAFSVQVLSSFSNVRQFLSGQSSIKDLEKQSAAIAHGRLWSCIYVLTRPLLYVAALFLATIAICLNQIKAVKTAHYAERLKNRALSLYADQSFTRASHAAAQGKPYKLISCKNAPAPGTEDISLHPSIPHHEIPDQRVKKRTFRDPVLFKPDEGVCRGSSYWFLYLYLQTQHLFQDPVQHMAALGKLFAIGAPKEAILLQSLYIKKGKILNMRVGTLDQPAVRHPQVVFTQNSDNTLQDPIEAKRKIDNLPASPYAIGFVGCHACVYIKINQELGFYFDPNEGVYVLRGHSQGEQLLSFFVPDYLKRGEGVEMYPVQNRIAV